MKLNVFNSKTIYIELIRFSQSSLQSTNLDADFVLKATQKKERLRIQ